MDILNISKTIQILAAIFITLLVLIQGKGGGLSSSFSSSINVYHSKRGFEKVVMIATIVLGVLLVVNSIIIVVLS